MVIIVLTSIWSMLGNQLLLRAILTRETIKKTTLMLVRTTFTTIII
jgi:hypothetical protein